MMKIMLVMITLVVAGLAWRIIGMLSSDAIGMAIGMTLGVLSGVPTAALVLLARRPDDEDDGCERKCVDSTCVQQPVVYADEVTPYYSWARRAMGMPDLQTRDEPESRLEEIENMQQALDQMRDDEIRRMIYRRSQMHRRLPPS